MNTKGVALILAMFALLFISIVVAGFFMLATSDLEIITNHMGRMRALYIAEAGIEYAVSELRNSRNWSRAAAAAPITFPGGSSSSYDVTYPKAGASRVIESIGQADNFTAVIEGQVSIAGSSSPYTIKIVRFQEAR